MVNVIIDAEQDSGVHRGQAHKFYFREGLTIACYFFSMPRAAVNKELSQAK